MSSDTAACMKEELFPLPSHLDPGHSRAGRPRKLRAGPRPSWPTSASTEQPGRSQGSENNLARPPRRSAQPHPSPWDLIHHHGTWVGVHEREQAIPICQRGGRLFAQPSNPLPCPGPQQSGEGRREALPSH